MRSVLIPIIHVHAPRSASDTCALQALEDQRALAAQTYVEYKKTSTHYRYCSGSINTYIL